MAGDERSLGALMSDRNTNLRLIKQSPGGAGTNSATTGELIVPNGTKVLILDETKKHCNSRALFTRVRITE
jgi:hypothetical protein